jgi:hypothetical protein
MKEFKLLKQNLFIHQIFGYDLGNVGNLKELNRVIRITIDYMEPRAHYRSISVDIMAIIFILFVNKHNRYSDVEIIQKINDIEMWLNRENLVNHIAQFVPENTDIQAEIGWFIRETLNWDEGF